MTASGPLPHKGSQMVTNRENGGTWWSDVGGSPFLAAAALILCAARLRGLGCSYAKR